MGSVIPVRRREYNPCSYSQKVSIESEMAKQWNELTMLFDRKRPRLTVITFTLNANAFWYCIMKPACHVRDKITYILSSCVNKDMSVIYVMSRVHHSSLIEFNHTNTRAIYAMISQN